MPEQPIPPVDPRVPLAAVVGRRSVLTGVLGAGVLGAGAVTLGACGASGSSTAPASAPHVTPESSTTAVSAMGSATGSATATASSTASGTTAPDSGGTAASAGAGTPTWRQLSAQLQTSATLFAGAAASGLKGATPAVRTWAQAASRASATQAAVLAQDNVLAGTAVTPVTVTAHKFATQAAALKAIAAQQASLQRTLLGLAQRTTVGQEVLLLTSLGVFAHATAAPKVAPTAATKAPGTTDAGSRVDALQVLRSRVEAAVQGYETGAGRLAVGHAGVTLARQRIQELWAMRDTAQTALVAASATPSPVAVNYRMPGGFASWAAIRRTWGLLELDLLDAWARVAAASSGSDRAGAITSTTSQADVVQSRGVGMPTWPGWA